MAKIINIKEYLVKQSIIQITLFKVIASIFLFLILFILFYGQNFWEKQAIKFNYELLSIVSHVQINTQSRILEIEALKNDTSLSKNDKIEKVNIVFQSIIQEHNNYNYIIGYYDNELNLYFLDNHRDIIALEDIKSELTLSKINSISKDNKIIKVSLPIYEQGKLVGYVFAYAQNSDLVLTSFNVLSAIIILALSLSALIMISIRKHMKQLQWYLEKFGQIIVHGDSGNEEILNKLPELKPVLEKIASFTNDLKEVNIALETSKVNFIKIMEGISDGFYAIDRKWQFTFVNKETQRFMGKSNVDLMGKNILEVFPEFKDSISYEKIHKAMDENQTVHWEAGGLANSNQDHEFHAYPYNEGLTVFFRDITEAKRQQQEIDRLERLNLIGQLAAGISHEIRNPLTTVKGFLQFFGSKAQYQNDKEYMDLMIAEIDRANIIITDFLSLAKSNSDNVKSQNLNEVIHKVLPMLQADAFNNNKEVVVNLNNLPNIMINENEIKQLILNLVRNGLEATAENGCVRISTHLKEDRVVLEIKDQGKGIPHAIQEKIGTPFFTTKESGTGLGLVISTGIAQRHRASFDFKTGSEGTTFYTAFPAILAKGKDLI
ncbi:ATP-binding protein [Desulfosporosinus sp. HMP52]|uniref:two-component system sensor histidine kinase NtrB n=1 Tax=Desulfosporosinus sp. HMP52 TaxID=1487923 RepID=UPI001FA7126E|nr:ATP-binding protein [Desulfosporosinus sp. HMP52]